MSQSPNSIKSIFFALGANSAIAVAKFFAAGITGSGAMLAEAVHSVADSGNQLLLLLGLKHAKRPPTPDYPLGFGKSVYFWSFIVALILFTVGGLFSINEGLHKLEHPEPLTSPWIAIGVLAFSIVAEGISLWGCVREIKKVLAGRSYLRWFRESRRSELLVVFGEDIAALSGLCLALFAVVATMVTGDPFYDALGSMMIGVLLVIVAIMIGSEIKDLLIGQGVEQLVREEMTAFVEHQPGVRRVFNLLTLQMGEDVMVAIKAEMEEFPDSRSLIEAINQTEAAFRVAFPQVAWCFFEPDFED